MTCLPHSRKTEAIKRLRPVSLLHLYHFLSFCIVMMVLCSCSIAPFQKQVTSVLKPEFPALQKKYQEKAESAERRGDLYRASFYFWILASLKSDNLLEKERYQSLLANSQQKADQHFLTGLTHLDNNNLNSAQREFLIALNYNPRHTAALNNLKINPSQPDFRVYKAGEGESLRSIAMREYRNAEMVNVIAHYNDLKSTHEFKEGSAIKLITPEGPYRVEKQAVKADIVASYQEEDSSFTRDILQRANNSFQSKNYSNAMSLAKMVLKSNSEHLNAKKILNQSGYQLAKIHIANGNDLDALRLLENVDSHYRDVAAIKAEVQNNVIQKAEFHYRQGVKYFLAEEFAAAASEWKTTLRLNPDHHKALKGLANVRQLPER